MVADELIHELLLVPDELIDDDIPARLDTSKLSLVSQRVRSCPFELAHVFAWR
jgi:hypothetical protein